MFSARQRDGEERGDKGETGASKRQIMDDASSPRRHEYQSCKLGDGIHNQESLSRVRYKEGCHDTTQKLTALSDCNTRPPTILDLCDSTTTRARAAATKTAAGMICRKTRSNFCVKSKSPRHPRTPGPREPSLRQGLELMVCVGECSVERIQHLRPRFPFINGYKISKDSAGGGGCTKGPT